MSTVDAYMDFLELQRAKIEKALPKHISYDRFISGVGMQLSGNEKLLECDKNSLFESVMKAAASGLYLDGIESALVPRQSRVTFMTMYQGLLKLIRNSGEIKDLNAQVVYENDEFEYFTDEKGEHITHKRVFGKPRGNKIAVFCVASTKDGGVYVEVMDSEQIEQVKKKGGATSYSPWNGPFVDEMWKKSVIRRINKRLPSSTDMDTAFLDTLHADDELFIPETETTPEPEPVSQKLNEAVLGSAEVKEVEQEVVGLIKEVFSRDYPKPEGGAVKKYGAIINDATYATADSAIYMQLMTLKEDGVAAKINYITVPSGAKKIVSLGYIENEAPI